MEICNYKCKGGFANCDVIFEGVYILVTKCDKGGRVGFCPK